MQVGSLFASYFLEEGIKNAPRWNEVGDDEVAAFAQAARERFASFTPTSKQNEANTERDLIWPVLELLGWGHTSVQRGASQHDVPDITLFPNREAKAAADLPDASPYLHAVGVVESKRWQRPLDRADKAETGLREGPPSSQINRYLTVLQGPSGHRLHWGILTNGRFWRLYYVMARSRSEDFLELDLADLLGLEGFAPDLFAVRAEDRAHWLKVFFLLFGRPAFPASADNRDCFLVHAVDEGQNWESRVAGSLRALVFERVFPDLVAAIADNDPQRPRPLGSDYCEEVRQAALVLLYRILFVLYAEDRSLLPAAESKYDDYGLRKRVRDEIAARIDGHDVFAARIDNIYGHMRGLFRAIAEGEESLGLPPYNGGLFDPAATPILNRVQIPDAIMATVIDSLSRTDGDGRRLRINYQDLTVRQLGSIYEGLLEYEVRAENGGVAVVRDERARHASGSYYTPDPIVDLINERVAQPLVDGCLEAFRTEAKALASDRRPAAERLAALRARDPAAAILGLKFCDPAMGSGHFLVALVDFLADRVLEAIAEAEQTPPFAADGGDYVSPVAEAIDRVRGQILAHAEEHRWDVGPGQLDDRQLVRRMILKRCIYGVDLNPMAVELAKVSLWLHTFTIGAPLSFLDHHLRCGNSVLGDRVRGTVDWLQENGSLYINRYIQSAKRSAELMIDIERTADADIAEARRSAGAFADLEAATEPLRAFANLCTAFRALDFAAEAKARGLKGDERKRFVELRQAGLRNFLDGVYGDPVQIACGGEAPDRPREEPDEGLIPADPAPEQLRLGRRRSPTSYKDAEVWQAFTDILADAQRLADERNYLHWEIAFPGVWSDWESSEPVGGFDGVVGNPPYLRQELLGPIKPELKRRYASYDGAADLYVYFFERGVGLLRPGARLSYVVTNKWLRAGYGEALRDFFAEKTWVDSIVDFGHARQIFTQADVFPSVVVIRRPTGDAAPDETRVMVIPRDQLRLDEVSVQLETAAFPLPRAGFTRRSWQLDPPEVQRLMDKIRANGVSLKEYADVSPLYGVKTGLNDAYVVDNATRDHLCFSDSGCVELLRPFLRGQDIERWMPEWTGLWMIVLKSSENTTWPWSGAREKAEEVFARAFPSIYSHLKLHEESLQNRQDKGQFWWELRSCTYYDLLFSSKIMYTDVAWEPSFCRDEGKYVLSNAAYFLPSSDHWLVSVLNSPTGWWYAWRAAQHGKDDALRYFSSYMESVPIPYSQESPSDIVASLEAGVRERTEIAGGLLAFLRHEYGVVRPTSKLRPQTHKRDSNFGRRVIQGPGRILHDTAPL